VGPRAGLEAMARRKIPIATAAEKIISGCIPCDVCSLMNIGIASTVICLDLQRMNIEAIEVCSVIQNVFLKYFYCRLE
jgi:hypothetical protein